MDRRAIESYVIRAVTAESVSELHAIAQAARRAHPADADVDVIDRVCWAAVSHLFAARQQERRRPSTRSLSRAAARALARGEQYEPFDWKARAAGM